MGTVLRANLSKNNPYYISKDRYYELKHYCLQYQEWIKEIHDLKYCYSSGCLRPVRTNRSNLYSDNTSRIGIKIAKLNERVELINYICEQTDSDNKSLLLEGVTTGLSYEKMAARKVLKISKYKYYELYRKFFWLLDKER